MNKRTKDIMGELLRTEKTLTISGLAKLYQVSERTIRNDLNRINDWLGQNGLNPILLGSSGKIAYQPEVETAEKLALENDLYSYKLSKEERRRLIAAILVSASEYTTLAAIAEMLFVSRVTIINDLDGVKQLLEEEGLRVISHSSKGLRVEGAESRKRDLLLYLCRTEQAAGQPGFEGNALGHLAGILAGIGRGEEPAVRKIINEQEHANKSFLTDDSFQELVWYLSILLERVRRGNVVESGIAAKQKSAAEHKYDPMAAGLVKELSGYCGITIPEEETAGLSSRLSRLRYMKKEDFDGSIVKTQLITRQFIEAVSRTLEQDFNDDYVFYENLANHLQSIFESQKLPLQENPSLEQIVKENETVGQAVECNKDMIEKYIRRPLSPIELTYIAVHICAALERRKNNHAALHVILVCHSGIGTSQLLLERLKNHFQFQIAEVMAAHEANRLKKGQADLVISTVRLPECGIDSVVVSPALDDADYLRVGHLIDTVRMRREADRGISSGEACKSRENICFGEIMDVIKPVIHQYKDEREDILLSKLEEAIRPYFNGGSQADEPSDSSGPSRPPDPPLLCQLLTADHIALEADCRDWRESVRMAANRLLEEGAIEERYLSAMIHNIEENGPYVVISPGFALPHDAADAGTRRVGMNLIRLREPILFGDEDAQPVRFVCCLSAVDHDRHLPAFFHLVNLLQNQAFKEMLERSRTPEEMAEGISRFESALERV